MNKSHKTFLVNILHKDGHWTERVSIKGRSLKDARKRVRALKQKLNAEQPVAIVGVAK